MLPAQEALLFSEFYQEEVSTISTFRRLCKDGEVFFCEKYSRVKRRNSYTVAYICASSGLRHHGQILYFALLKNRPAALLKKAVELPAGEQFLPTTAVFPVQVTSDLEVIGVPTIQEKVIFISTAQSTSYIAKFPCTLNID